jgi:L-lactate dehydrogenase complex protein LldE
MKTTTANEAGPNVGLFVTCLVDLFRPSIGFSAVTLLEDAGCSVDVPMSQTCCGQPAFNSGDRKDARAIGEQVIDAFEQFDYVVAPSGSCAGMLKKHYPELFAGDPAWEKRATDFAAKVHELTSFLVDVVEAKLPVRTHGKSLTYHDSCSGLRELNVKDQPRKLLRQATGAKVSEMADPDVCCGFGGTFCVKYPDISNDIVTRKTADITATGADMLVAGDLGCLMNMAGKLKRQGSKIEVRHVAEVLAGNLDTAPIGGRD